MYMSAVIATDQLDKGHDRFTNYALVDMAVQIYEHNIRVSLTAPRSPVVNDVEYIGELVSADLYDGKLSVVADIEDRYAKHLTGIYIVPAMLYLSHYNAVPCILDGLGIVIDKCVLTCVFITSIPSDEHLTPLAPFKQMGRVNLRDGNAYIISHTSM